MPCALPGRVNWQLAFSVATIMTSITVMLTTLILQTVFTYVITPRSAHDRAVASVPASTHTSGLPYHTLYHTAEVYVIQQQCLSYSNSVYHTATAVSIIQDNGLW